MNKKQFGFTLIELILVMAILSTMSILILSNIFASLAKGRDSRRKQDLSHIPQALELYKLDQNPQAYPTGALDNLCNQCWSSGSNCSGNIYIRKFPCDPVGGQTTPYFFERDLNDTLKYELVACLENPADNSKDQTTHVNCASTGTSYTVHEP